MFKDALKMYVLCDASSLFSSLPTYMKEIDKPFFEHWNEATITVFTRFIKHLFPDISNLFIRNYKDCIQINREKRFKTTFLV